MVASYFNFQTLPDEVKKAWGIRSKTRLDCVSFADNLGFIKDIQRFVNAKKQLAFYLSKPVNYIQANPKRLTDLGLTNGSNFTSLFFPDLDYSLYAWGDFQEWGLLFLFQKDYKAFEMLAIPNGKNLINGYCQKLIDNEFDTALKYFRTQAKPFFDYWHNSNVV
jgi:hypothetical protein